MKHKVLVQVSTALVVIVVTTCAVKVTKPGSKEALPASTVGACGSQTDLNVAINKNLSSEDWQEADETRKKLVKQSNESALCRMEITKALIEAMDKPQLNFVTDRGSYFLWLNGSAILGELKAVETLDLLINHLDLNDGTFSASMVHQPAILGVTAMGLAAVPKLSVALQHNGNRNIRLAAALCLADIGGPEAMSALEQALSSETDTCITRFIRISIEISNNELKAKGRTFKQSDMDAQTDLRRQLLIAFKCDN